MRSPSLGLLLAAQAVAPAASAAVIRIVGDSAGCPAPAAVARELRPLVPRDRVVAGGPPGGTVRVEVWDERERYGVAVKGTRRELADATRSCEDRARAAAIVVALAIYPPPVAAPPSLRTGPPARPNPFRTVLELGPLFETAPGAAGLFSAGISVRAYLGWRHAGIALGAALQTSAIQDLGAARARLSRTPFDIGVRGQVRWGKLELAGDLGMAATLIGIAGEDLASRNDTTRVEISLRSAALVRLRVGERLAPFVAVQALFTPAPFELAVDPDGVVGYTPRLRLAGIVGLAVRLH